MQTVRTRALVEGALLAALVAILGLTSYYTGLGWLQALPILLAYLRNGGRNAVLVTVVGCFVLLLLGGPLPALSTLGFGAALGLVPGWAVRRGAGVALTLVAMSVAFSAVTVLGALGAIVVWHQDIWAETWNSSWKAARTFLATHASLLAASGLTPASALALLRDLVPIIIGVGVLGQALAVYVLAAVVLGRLGQPLPTVPSFARWRAPRWLLWVYVAALGAYGLGLGHGQQVLAAVALNFVVGLGALYSVIGVAAVYGWLRHRGLTRRSAVFTAAIGGLLVEASRLSVLLALLGMLASQFDTSSWMSALNPGDDRGRVR